MKVYVCTGKHCRKKSECIEAVLRAAGPKTHPVSVKCQKICKGPVVGVKLGGQVEWFKEVDSPKSLHALARMVSKGVLVKPLEKRRVPKRSGALRC
ncbi:MAG: hypothetical protein AAGD10_09795 [Myxococcota bacterium]